MGSLEYGDQVHGLLERLPLPVGPRDVAQEAQAPVRGEFRQEGNVAHVQPRLAARHQRAEGVAGDEPGKRSRIVDAEGARHVQRHGESLRSSAASCSAVPTLSHGPEWRSPVTRPSSTKRYIQGKSLRRVPGAMSRKIRGWNTAMLP